MSEQSLRVPVSFRSGRLRTAALLAVALMAVLLPTSLLPGASAGTDIATGQNGNEPTAGAVNPLNPQNVVVARCNLRISNDFGRTFPITTNVGIPAGYNNTGQGCDDVVTFDSQGRLFWTYLLRGDLNNDGTNDDLSVVVQQVNPTTGALVGNAADITADTCSGDDKPWLVADSNPASPFRDNLYIIWTRVSGTCTPPSGVAYFSRSTNGGVTWSAPRQISAAGEGFVWPSHITTAPNGDVYASYHGDTCGAATASIFVLRDTTGGANLANGTAVQKSSFASSVTCNQKNLAGSVPQAQFWMQGANAPYVIADPVRPGNVYVISNDDPNDNFGNGDDGDVVLHRSTDNGLTWTASRIDHAPAGSLQVYPIGATDQDGKLVVMWWDTRGGQTNAANNFLLDVYATFSRDGGLTWTNDTRINDVAFDPDAGAPCRFGPTGCGTTTAAPNTLRIGEYNGLVAADGIAYSTFTGNTFTGSTATGQRVLFDVVSIDGAFADRFEPNDSAQPGVATDLGAHASYSQPGLSIHRDNDEDVFKVTAASTGRLDVHIGSNPRLSDLDVQVLDRNGNAVSTATSGADDNAGETITFPAVAGEAYFVRVYADPGAPAAPTQFPVLNTYNLNVLNTPAPAPTSIALAPGSDTGSSSTDNVTSNTQPTLLIRLDTTALGTVPFSPGTNPATDAPGYKVAVYANGVLIGYATPAGAGIFSLTPAAPLSAGLNFITARVVIVDPLTPTPHVVGFGPESGALIVTIVTGPPATLGPPDLIAPADSGGIDDDDITTLSSPTFVGTATPNALVRLYANGVQVGEGIAAAGTGEYRITVGPLTDGVYQITARQEDGAGNLSAPSSGLKVTIAKHSLTLPGGTAVQGAGTVTVDLGAGTISGYAGVAGATGLVGIVGIPQVNLAVGNRALKVVGTAGDDQLTYSPTGASAGNLSNSGASQVLSFMGVTQLDVDPVGGSDTVTIVGTPNADDINSTVDTTAVSQVGSLLALRTVTASTERLAVRALLGADTVFITTKSTVNASVFVDAGDPAANTPKGDVLRIVDGSGKGNLQNGPGGAVAGSGSFIMNYSKSTGRTTRIDYAGVEKIVKK